MRKILWIALTLLVPITFVAGFRFAESHWRNHFLWSLVVHYPWERVKGYAQFYDYWQGFMRELRFDEENRVYSFSFAIDKAKREGNAWNAGLLQYHQGHLDQAIIHLNKQEDDDDEVLFWRSMAHLRRGINARCLEAGNGLSKFRSVSPQCSIPVALDTSDRNPDLAEAETLLKRLLNRNSRDKHRRLWLLNLSLLFNGENPVVMNSGSGLRNEFTEGTGANTSDSATGIRLVNRGHELGVDNFDAGKGVAVEDFDRDGDLDIVTGGFYEATRFYKNHEGIRFVDHSAEMGVSEIKGAHIITAADYDNDRWIDLLISHPTGTHAYGGFSLLKNEQGKRFVDVTYESGLLNPDEMSARGAFTWMSAWADIDNDGDLDLFVANWGGKQLINGRPALDSALYLNEQGRFKDVSQQFGLRAHLRKNLIVGAAFGDYDGDGFPDLALASMMPGFPVLFKNLEGKRFQAVESVRSKSNGGFTVAFVDLNHDGRLDLFRGVALLPDSNIETFIADREIDHGFSLVWVQQDDGRFELSENFFQNHRPMGSMGANFGDLNNDGAYDFYLGSGGPQPWYLVPNALYLGGVNGTRPTDRLEDITLRHGAGSFAKGHGIVFFDFDNDGDQDIYSSLGGMWPGDRWPNELFENQTETPNAWIKLRLEGDTANHYGLGALIRVQAENAAGKPIVRYYHMDNKTGFGSAPYIAHIGLLDAEKLTDVAVRWPGQRHFESYPVKLRRFNTVRQNRTDVKG